MSRPHPAATALAVIAVVSAVGLWSFIEALNEMQGDLQWEGEEVSAEVILAWAFFDFGYSLVMPALGMASAASTLGLVLVWCLSPERRRRLTEAASPINRIHQSEERR